MDARLRLRPVPRGGRGRRVLAGAGWLVAAGVFSGCSQPAPRTFYDFLHDKISREATLARCDRAGAASARDLECARARRAALTIELRRERMLQARYQKESERKIAALEARIAARARADRARQPARAAAAAGLPAQPRLPVRAPPATPGATQPRAAGRT